MAGSSGIEKINIPEKFGNEWTQDDANRMHIIILKLVNKLNELISKGDDYETRITGLGG